MVKKNLAVLLVCSIALPPAAADVDLNPDHPERYVVKQGDTLWGIAGLYLKKPWLWPDIWHVNPQIGNPHRIYPGDSISLAFRDGKPRLALTRGRDVRLSPTVGEFKHDNAIPAIPLDALWPFLNRPRVMGPDELARAAYILSSQDEHLAAGAGHRIYVRGLQDPDVTRYTVFRCGEVYREPPAVTTIGLKYSAVPSSSQTYASTCGSEGRQADVLGYEAIHVADAVVERFGDLSTAVVTRSHREVLVGDRLLPETGLELPEFIPHAPAGAVDGTIISLMDALSGVGPYQVVVVNRGTQAGLEPGHVLGIYQSGVVVSDQLGTQMQSKYGSARREAELPHEHIGELMVFRSFTNVSYALVMRVARPVHVYDAVKSPS